jgi:hypothetical protein
MSEATIWRILVVAAAALVLIGNAAIWVDRSLADRDEFVETAADELAQLESRQQLAEQIVFALMGNQPLVYQLAGPVAEQAVTRLLATPALQPLLTLIANGLYQMVVNGDPPTTTIGPMFLPPIVAAIIAAAGPGPAFGFPGQQVDIQPFANQQVPSLERFIDVLQDIGLLCGIAGLVILVLSVVVDRNRSRAIRRVAITLVAVLAVSLVAIIPLRSLYLSQIDNETAHSITSEVFNAFTIQFIVQSLLLLLIPAAILLGISIWLRNATTPQPEGQRAA